MINLTKCNALGNDFLILDCITMPSNTEFIKQANIKNIGHRRFGIGCDQFIVLEKSHNADGKIIFYNADGSRAEACGNGTVACAVYIAKLLEKNEVSFETDVKVVRAVVNGNDATVTLPKAESIQIDLNLFQKILNDENDYGVGCDLMQSGIMPFKLESVSVGNPHCVLILEDYHSTTVNSLLGFDCNRPIDTILLDIGFTIANMTNIFPNRTNVEFVVRTGENAFDCFVWERGAGATLACGTGACAVAFAVAKNGLADGTKPIFVTMAGSYQGSDVIPMKIELQTDCTLFTNTAKLGYTISVNL